jgi:hypothetical protein
MKAPTLRETACLLVLREVLHNADDPNEVVVLQNVSDVAKTQAEPGCPAPLQRLDVGAYASMIAPISIDRGSTITI